MSEFKKILITIEGNIGGGKSTLIKHLQNEYPNFVIIPEPVEQWLSMKDMHGKSILEYFYEDKDRWSYTFQNCAFITRFLSAFEAMNQPITQDTIYISERGILTDRYVFATMLKKSNCLSDIEWNLYCKWFDHFSKTIQPKGIVFVTTDPDVCSSRIKSRGRTGEEHIPLDYLKDLHNHHEAWINSIEEHETKVCRVNSDKESIHIIADFALNLLRD